LVGWLHILAAIEGWLTLPPLAMALGHTHYAINGWRIALLAPQHINIYTILIITKKNSHYQ